MHCKHCRAPLDCEVTRVHADPRVRLEHQEQTGSRDHRVLTAGPVLRVNLDPRDRRVSVEPQVNVDQTDLLELLDSMASLFQVFVKCTTKNSV